MTFLRREGFEQTVLEGVLGFVNRHCKDRSIFNKKDEVEAKIDLFFGRNPKISRVASEIGLITKTQTANTELLIRTTLELAYDNYKVDMEQQQKEISFLRRELRVAQQKSRLDVASATKRETETRAKERIISQKNLKLEKLNKENGGLKKQVAILKKENSKMLQDKEIRSTSGDKNRKKEKKDKRFSDKIKLITFDDSIRKDEYKREKSEMYIYDIPKKYKNTDVEAIITNNFGKLVSYEIKRLHKYQLIKAEIYLYRDWCDKVLGKQCYTTITHKEKILNLRYIFTHNEKKLVDEAWKRKGIIKIPDYTGERDNIRKIAEYLQERKLNLPIVYGKNLIIQGELYFWAIFASDERVKQAIELSKQEGVDNGWEILTNSKGFLPKKALKENNLLSTIPRKNEEKQKNKGKKTSEKSQLRKEYEAKTTITKIPFEEEVVEIVDKFRKGVLDVNAKEFTPGQNSEQKQIILEPNEVVEIIKEDCRSTNKEDTTKQGKNERSTSTTMDGAKRNISSQQVLSKHTVDKYNETNARCEDNLRKVTEVKSDRKRVISKDREDRIKFQAIKKEKF